MSVSVLCVLCGVFDPVAGRLNIAASSLNRVASRQAGERASGDNQGQTAGKGIGAHGGLEIRHRNSSEMGRLLTTPFEMCVKFRSSTSLLSMGNPAVR